MNGRRKPYTAIGIRRLRCACGKQAHATWTCCADRNWHRPACVECDVRMNEMFMEFMRVPGRKSKLAAYRRSLNG